MDAPADTADEARADAPDFAGEHNDTAVDKRIIEGEDDEREEESPRGWSGME
jgi:hypothetical protein